MNAHDKTHDRRAEFIKALRQSIDDQARAGNEVTPEAVLPNVADLMGSNLHWVEATPLTITAPFPWPQEFLSPLVRRRRLTAKQRDRLTAKLAATRPETRRLAVLEFGGAVADPAVAELLSQTSLTDRDAMVRGLGLMVLGIGGIHSADELLRYAKAMVADAQLLEYGTSEYDEARDGAGHALLGSLAAAVREHRVSVAAEVERVAEGLDPRSGASRSSLPSRQREALLRLARQVSRGLALDH